jgi:dTDP-4-dehydrorhamnose 3,5-epimerase
MTICAEFAVPLVRTRVNMQISNFDIVGPTLFTPKKNLDARGCFIEIFRQSTFEGAIGPIKFVQENYSYSKDPGTIRGLHFQVAPSAQAKLVRVTAGAVFDVAVDLRRSSSTYGRHIAVELSSDSLKQLFIPAGFAHGFCTLKPHTEVCYKVSSYYDPASERGLI